MDGGCCDPRRGGHQKLDRSWRCFLLGFGAAQVGSHCVWTPHHTATSRQIIAPHAGTNTLRICSLASALAGASTHLAVGHENEARSRVSLDMRGIAF